MWLEEVLFHGSIEDKWLMDASFKISNNSIDAQVSWIDSKLITREIEIKAVTMHELIFKEISDNEIVEGIDGVIPTEGPDGGASGSRCVKIKPLFLVCYCS